MEVFIRADYLLHKSVHFKEPESEPIFIILLLPLPSGVLGGERDITLVPGESLMACNKVGRDQRLPVTSM